MDAFTASAGNHAGVERFAPIEGLRAWLAWGVFFGHIVLFAGLSRIGIPTWAGEITTTSVEVFIIVSGFVIVTGARGARIVNENSLVSARQGRRADREYKRSLIP